MCISCAANSALNSFEVSHAPLHAFSPITTSHMSAYSSTFVVCMANYEWRWHGRKKKKSTQPGAWWVLCGSRVPQVPPLPSPTMFLIHFYKSTQSAQHEQRLFWEQSGRLNLLSVFHSFITIRAPFNISDWSVGGRGGVTGRGLRGGRGCQNVLLHVWINHKPVSKVRQKPSGFVPLRRRGRLEPAVSQSVEN